MTPKSVLVADASFQIRRNLQLILQAEGYEVLLARNGHEALNHCLLRQVDLALVDPALGDIDGRTLLKCLKLNPPTAQIPVLFLASTVSTKEALHAMSWGALDVLIKPIDTATLVGRVGQFMSQSIMEGHVISLTSETSKNAYAARVDGRQGDRLLVRMPTWRPEDEECFVTGTEGEVQFKGADETIYRQSMITGRPVQGRLEQLEVMLDGGYHRSSRRQCMRMDVEIPLRYRIGQSFYRVGTVDNLSGGGMRIANGPAGATIGEPIALELRLPQQSDPLPLAGEIAWTRSSDGSQNAMGISFSTLSAPAQAMLIRYLFSEVARILPDF
jgi:CheY-like chemotaxis protein/c-di-GMP-binding flagellar brake protein YcgR